MRLLLTPGNEWLGAKDLVEEVDQPLLPPRLVGCVHPAAEVAHHFLGIWGGPRAKLLDTGKIVLRQVRVPDLSLPRMVEDRQERTEDELDRRLFEVAPLPRG